MKTMKMFMAMFVAATMFAFVGCSKDDVEGDIIGTWKVTGATMTETYNGQSHTENVPMDQDARLTFNEDKTFQATTDGQVVASGTWSVKDDQLTMSPTQGEMDIETAKVKIDGDTMTLTVTESQTYGDESISVTMVMTLKKV